jgi:hypothetical protein
MFVMITYNKGAVAISNALTLKQAEKLAKDFIIDNSNDFPEITIAKVMRTFKTKEVKKTTWDIEKHK